MDRRVTRPIPMRLSWLPLLAALWAAPLPAQVRLNYQDAEITSVVTALAEMAGLNVIFVGVDPNTRVTVKMATPISTDRIPGLLRTILESAGLVAVERDGMLQVLSTGAARAQGETQVFVHTLRHGSASEIALTLAAVYGSSEAAASQVPQRPRSLSQQNRSESSLGIPPGTPGVMAPGGQGLGRTQDSGGQSPVVGGVMVGDAVVVPYTPTNSLIIRTTPRNFAMLQQTIEQLDARPDQVMIEVFVAEVSLDERTELGVDWAATFGAGRTVRSAERFPTFADSTPGGLVVRALALGRNVDVRATLRAVAADSRVNVLASPSILARNNQEARILVGSQVPFTQIARSGLSGEVLDRVIQFRDVGTELAIIPTINQDGYVTLDVLQQVSNLTTQTLFGAPVITVREAQTSAIVQDRQTIVIGGLIDTEDTRIHTGIPYLKDIPLLGYLFRDTERRGRKTELVIFLTPYLVRSDEEADAMRERAIDRTNNSERIRREMERRRLAPTEPRPVPADTTAPPPPAPPTPR